MKKDAYYFPHFSNARNDVKILKLRRVLGAEGYAIYFMLLEILRDQTEWKFPLSAIPELEFELRVSKEKIGTVIMDFELFEVDQTKTFFSPKLIQYLQPYIEKSLKARESARIRWDNANALKEYSDGNASKGEERTGEENKVKQSISEKKEEFRQGLVGFIPKYGKAMITDFFLYWVEPSQDGRKLRFQGQKFFHVPRRLATWKKNDDEKRTKFGGNSQQPTATVAKWGDKLE